MENKFSGIIKIVGIIIGLLLLFTFCSEKINQSEMVIGVLYFFRGHVDNLSTFCSK